MNALQIAKASKPTTIGELLAYLQAMEAAWTEQDTQYLGTFENQPLYCLHPEGGIAHAYGTYLAEFGLTLFPVTKEI